MNEKVLEAWRLMWPKVIPTHEYEAALQMAALIGVIGRKPEAEPAPAQRESRSAAPTPRASKNEGEYTLSTADVAKLAGMTISSVSYHARKGRLHVKRVGNADYFTQADVDAFIEARGGRKTHAGGRPSSRPQPQLQLVSAGELTTHDVAKLAGMDRKSISHHAKYGDLRGTKVGKDYRFTRADVDAWLAARSAKKNDSPSAGEA